MPRFAKIFLTISALLGTGIVFAATVHLPAVIADSMVLQQQSEVRVWGWATPGARVSVSASFLKKSVITTAASDSCWQVFLPTPAASFDDETIQINVSGQQINLQHVLIGEVWLASGQSNMQFRLCTSDGGLTAIANSENAYIRFFTQKHISALTDQRDCPGQWQQASIHTSGNFSAVAYYGALQLYNSLHVPVGIVHSSWAGSTAQAWLKPELVQRVAPELKIPKTLEENKPENRQPCGLYRAMTLPIAGYGIRGIWWYQGESGHTDPELYGRLFPQLTGMWRQLWNNDSLPVYTVEIPPYQYPDKLERCNFLREVQLSMTRHLKKLYLIPMLDMGDSLNLHPTNKRPVGERLALYSLHYTYGYKALDVYTARYKRLEIRHDSCLINFDRPIGSIVLTTSEGRAFEVAGADSVFYPAVAEKTKRGLLVHSAFVTEPKAVRYCFHDYTRPTLFGNNGLPAYPFRTDDFPIPGCDQSALSVYSPDRQIQAIIHPNPLSYQLIYGGDTITDPAFLSLTFRDGTVWKGGDRYTQKTNRHRGVVNPVVGKNLTIKDHYNELTLTYGTYQVVFRLYNEGVAYRFCALGQAADSLVVMDETAQFPLRKDPKVLFGETAKLSAWSLSNKVYEHVSNIDSGTYAITPTVLLPDTALTVVIAESDLHRYPGMYLKKRPEGLVGYWARSPRKWELGSYLGCCTVVTEREDYMAMVPGNHAFPWRILMPTNKDKTLLNNELVYLLAEPCRIDDTSWIRPGKTAWEWWHCAIVPDAPFPSGPAHLSTELYKYYIDFAAENDLEYILIDEGWNDKFHPFDLNPQIDIHEVIRYGKEKNVGVWLWMVFSTISQAPCMYMDTLSAWGAAGIKIDFFERDDDKAMFWYEELARLAAERHLMLDYHGCSKPTGMNRTWPNILTFEAVRGHECSKWDTSSNPDYRLQFIYGRNLAGPIDYTPGAMRNCYLEQFQPIDPGWPSGIGTRCQDLAMYVIFDQYFAMLIDSPDAYRQDSTILRYLSQVPVVWDETIALDGRVGETAVMAKRSSDTWYVAGMCSWKAATATVSLDFLEPGIRYRMHSFTDVPSDTMDASRYTYTETTVTRDSVLTLNMASGGGFVVRLVK